MGNIISDISKRVLIVEGIEEVDRIRSLSDNKDDFIISKIAKNIYKVEVISQVGSLFEK